MRNASPILLHQMNWLSMRLPVRSRQLPGRIITQRERENAEQLSLFSLAITQLVEWGVDGLHRQTRQSSAVSVEVCHHQQRGRRCETPHQRAKSPCKAGTGSSSNACVLQREI